MEFKFLENLKKGSLEFWKYLEEMEKELPKIQNKIEGKIEQGVIVEGKVVLGKNSIIKAGTRIEGNIFIGENCEIGPNAYLRKNVFIGNGCKIGMSEVKNSIILDNTNVPHFNYVGDSVIGEDCNLGGGSKIANLRFDEKNILVEINGKKVDSGRRKLGAFVGSGTKTGANSTINCGIIIGKNCRIFPNTFIKENMKDGETR